MVEDRARGSVRVWAVGSLTLVALVTSACGSSADDPAAGDGRTAAVYESILDWLIQEEPGPANDDDPELTVFVASRSEGEIDLDVQVAMVDAFDSGAFVRFIDERSEALDDDADDKRVHDDGILVGLGAVAQEGDPIEVYTDRYRNTDDVEAWLITMRRSGDGWVIVETPVATEVRPLPAET